MPNDDKKRAKTISLGMKIAIIFVVLVAYYAMAHVTQNKEETPQEIDIYQQDTNVRLAALYVKFYLMSDASGWDRNLAWASRKYHNSIHLPAAKRRLLALNLLYGISDYVNDSGVRLDDSETKNQYSEIQWRKLKSEQELWEKIYARDYGPQEAEEIVSGVGELQLGVLEGLVVANVYREANMSDRAMEVLSDTKRVISLSYYKLVWTGVVLAVSVIVGAIFIIVALIRRYPSQLSTVPAGGAEHGLFYSFLAFLISYPIFGWTVYTAFSQAGSDNKIVHFATCTLNIVASFVVALIVYLRFSDYDLNKIKNDIGLRWLGVWRTVKEGTYAYFSGVSVGILGMVFATIALGILAPNRDYTSENNYLQYIDSDPALTVVYFVFIIVIRPIIEELVFRGALFGSLRKQSNFWISALISSAAYGIWSGYGSSSLGLFGLGLVLCVFRERTNSTVPGIVGVLIANAVFWTFFYTLGLF